MAQIGLKVLLVDADLRRARLHRTFEVAVKPGLREAIVDQRAWDDKDFAAFVRETEVPGLTLMPAGDRSDEMSGAVLFSDRVGLLFDHLRAEYDVVLVDTAPALALPDARLIGRFSDGVILVVRSRVTHREATAATVQRLTQDGIRVLGMVLNDWTPSPDRHYGAVSYAYGYARKVDPADDWDSSLP
jgi:capsular exopolysaccharide synthesis family protein